MKKIALVILTILIVPEIYGQMPVESDRSLVVRLRSDVHRELVLKPGKKITILTDYGGKLTTRNYDLLENQMILFNQMDTVGAAEIISIRGRVRGNAERKVAGTAVAVGGFFMSWLVYDLNRWSGGSNGFAAVPYAAIGTGGILLAGPRTYNTAKKWELVIK